MCQSAVMRFCTVFLSLLLVSVSASDIENTQKDAIAPRSFVTVTSTVAVCPECSSHAWNSISKTLKTVTVPSTVVVCPDCSTHKPTVVTVPSTTVTKTWTHTSLKTSVVVVYESAEPGSASESISSYSSHTRANTEKSASLSGVGFTIGTQTGTAFATGFSSAGSSLAPGGPGLSTEGVSVSLDTSGILDIGSSTITLPTVVSSHWQSQQVSPSHSVQSGQSFDSTFGYEGTSAQSGQSGSQTSATEQPQSQPSASTSGGWQHLPSQVPYEQQSSSVGSQQSQNAGGSYPQSLNTYTQNAQSSTAESNGSVSSWPQVFTTTRDGVAQVTAVSAPVVSVAPQSVTSVRDGTTSLVTLPSRSSQAPGVSVFPFVVTVTRDGTPQTLTLPLPTSQPPGQAIPLVLSGLNGGAPETVTVTVPAGPLSSVAVGGVAPSVATTTVVSAPAHSFPPEATIEFQKASSSLVAALKDLQTAASSISAFLAQPTNTKLGNAATDAARKANKHRSGLAEVFKNLADLLRGAPRAAGGALGRALRVAGGAVSGASGAVSGIFDAAGTLMSLGDIFTRAFDTMASLNAVIDAALKVPTAQIADSLTKSHASQLFSKLQELLDKLNNPEDPKQKPPFAPSSQIPTSTWADPTSKQSETSSSSSSSSSCPAPTAGAKRALCHGTDKYIVWPYKNLKLEEKLQIEVQIQGLVHPDDIQRRGTLDGLISWTVVTTEEIVQEIGRLPNVRHTSRNEPGRKIRSVPRIENDNRQAI